MVDFAANWISNITPVLKEHSSGHSLGSIDQGSLTGLAVDGRESIYRSPCQNHGSTTESDSIKTERMEFKGDILPTGDIFDMFTNVSDLDSYSTPPYSGDIEVYK